MNKVIAEIKSKYQVRPLIGLGEKNREEITSLYKKEPVPIFEHNFIHVTTYLRFGKELFLVKGDNGSAIIVYDPESKRYSFFTPQILKSKFLLDLARIASIFPQKNFQILNVSKSWKDGYLLSLKKCFRKELQVINRSQDEAVYDLRLLNELKGKDFSMLRYRRNKLLEKKRLVFYLVNRDNLEKAIGVIRKWNEVQGIKYAKNKEEKEIFVIQELVKSNLNNKLFNLEMGIINDRGLSLVLYFIHPNNDDYGQIYLLKGINRKGDGGEDGVSDATYLYAFRKMYEKGALFCNDGELGCEEGTRKHKLGFKPREFFQSFDININL